MNTQAGELDRAIDLIRSIIKKNPSDSGSRLRLLTLLHTKRHRYDFVVEAHDYKANCDLTFDTNWGRICEMGREIDPGNGFFGKHPAPGNHKSSNHNTSTPNGSQPHPVPNAETGKSDAITEQRVAGDDPERRDFVERRLEDRRKNYSAWFGEKRRKYQQRQKRRRE